ncbi:SRPBCC family protein [Agromyces marinus]|nr:SRPBCC domain-containing protein [Agromyces marinus]UIP57324.1 hypothetical protein DSM26151_01790 [Agromyces marinus]
MPDAVFDIERTFAIDRATMWSLWTDAAHAARWMRPSITDYDETDASIDARPGGSYRFELRGPDATYATSGTYVDVDPMERLSFTWRWDDSDEETLVEVRFADDVAGTRVRITHTRFASAESAERHGDGWRGCLDSIAAVFEPTRG